MKKIITITLALLFSSLAYSQVSYNQEFQVNTQGGFPTQPNIANLTNNNFIVCWQSKNDGDWFGIFSQIFTEFGEKVGTEFQVNTYSVEGQQYPDVTGLTNGRFVICWQGKSLWDYSTEIFAQIYNNDGSKMGGEFRVNTNELNYQGKPSISSLSNGKFVICWESNENENTNGPFKIRCQIYNSEGSKIGSEIVVNPVSLTSNIQPKVDHLSNGGFVVTWRGDNNISAQLFDGNGIKNGESLQVNTQTRSKQLYPSVSALSNGEFVIAWSSGNNWQKNIYAQNFLNSGVKIGNEFRVNTNNVNQHIYPNTSSLSDGRYVIFWTTGQYFTEVNLLQIYDSTNSKIGVELNIEGPANGIFWQPSICNINNSKIVTVWQNSNNLVAKYFLEEPVYHPLNTFKLLLPESDVIIRQRQPLFVWNSTSETKLNYQWELTYDLYLDTNSSFIDPTITTGIVDTAFQYGYLFAYQTYYWKVLARNYYGDSLWSSDTYDFYIDPTSTGVKEIEAPMPEKFRLFQNYPNPFNPTTKIKFSIPANVNDEMSIVQLKVYDLLGNEIATLVDEQKQPGTYEVEFSATGGLSSGIYFCRLNAGKYSQTSKMILMK